MTQQTPRLSIALAALCTLTLAACSGASAKADAALAEATRTDEAAAGTPPADTRTLTLPEQPCVEWVGTKTNGKHDGGFGACAGKVQLSSDGALIGIEVTVDATSLFSDNGLLSLHLKSDDFLGVDTYPVATFSSSSITPRDDGSYDVTGTFDVHGVSKEKTFIATSAPTGSGWAGEASMIFLRSDHAISYVSEGEEDPIADEVAMTVRLTTSP